MAETVILDAMIKRDDFALKGPPLASAEPIKSLSIENLTASGMLVPLLRKPDFQRETNHWKPAQVIAFLESFLDNELIPSIILWQSESFVFVIDGAHRLSALRAWIEDDFGDGALSLGYFSNEISNVQRRTAKKVRAAVEDKIGKYSLLKDALINPQNHSPIRVQRARNMATRALSLQWVNGDADKAETSFFKINTQGTPLDKSEELILRNRKRSIAIAARSIVRAGTGHKYWSKFSDEIRFGIEEKSKEIHHSLFNPEVDAPIKTLDLPLGGTRSPISALELLMDLISITNSGQNETKRTLESFEEDPDGNKTIEVLRKSEKTISRISGTNSGSLGLHPAVYFYSERGRHIPDLLLGIAVLFKKKIANNDKEFFQKFTSARREIEDYLIENKSLITQALQLVRSATRFERVADLYEFLTYSFDRNIEFSEAEMISVISPNSVSKILAISENTNNKSFSDDAKSAIFIRDALSSALRCPICGAFIDPTKSASYDHIIRLRDGGTGSHLNGQVTHPYCNSGVRS